MTEADTSAHNNGIDDIPTSCIPFYLLSPVQRDILKLFSEGLSDSEIVASTGRNIKTISNHRSNMGTIGLPDRLASIYGKGELDSQRVVLSLIQDGVSNGYLQHFMPKDAHIVQLSELEEEVMKGICNGDNIRESAENLFLSTATIIKHRSNIYTKLDIGTSPSVYFAVARYTHLQAISYFNEAPATPTEV